jgi:hypothetical protein
MQQQEIRLVKAVDVMDCLSLTHEKISFQEMP